MLKDYIPEIISFVNNQSERLRIEKALFDVYEGGLLDKVDAILRTQLGKAASQEAIERMPPINILKKLITKLSTLYVDKPERIPQNNADMDIVKKYEEETNLDSYLYDANIFFNLHKRVALEMYVDEGAPRIRALPGHQFLVWSNDRVNPTKPTVFIKFMGTVLLKDEKGSDKPTDIMWLYTDDEFLAITSEGNIYAPDMKDNPSGINPYGKIPFVYINSSRYNLLPEPDSELLRMTLLVPILYSDINFGAKYQVFSIIYGIDINMENLEYGPNVIWNFKSDEDGKQAQVGSIKPEIDMEAMTQSIANQLATFFETRNLRGSTISGFAAGRYGQQDSGGQTGVALLIQNLDTTEIRKAHAKIFKEAESKLWQLIAKVIHPTWIKASVLDDIKEGFSGDKVVTNFTPEYELKSDMELVTELKAKLDSGLVSKNLALKTLYPYLKQEDLDKLAKEIEQDNALQVEVSNVDKEVEGGTSDRSGEKSSETEATDN